MEESTRPNSKSSFVILVSLAAVFWMSRNALPLLILFVMAEKPPSMKFISSVDPGAGTVQRQHE